MANAAYARTICSTVEDMLKQDFRNSESWQRNGLLSIANQTFATGKSIQRDIEGTTTFGKKVALNCIFAPIVIAGENHLLLLTNDVSERMAAERALTESVRQLEQKELAKTRFLAAAGHDLRQPLAAANLYIDALSFSGLNDKQQHIIQRLEQAMATFNGLLDALLNISKLDAGIIKPEPSSIWVSELMNWLEQNFAALAASKRLGFKLFFSMGEPLAIHSDIGLVKSVLMNLVSNAIKFTPEGAIMVSARRRGNDVLFQVWDTGIGISEEHRALIFDEFYQVDNPQRDRSGGLGLGLSIAKRALLLLGGKITCRSQLGSGSVFSFSLPAHDAGLETEKPAGDKDSGDVTDYIRGRRFVLVEDDKLVSQAMTNLLEGMGAEVRNFHRAEDALIHHHIEQADCYIVDHMLGGAINGAQFLNQLSQKLGRPICAVLVTGDTSTETLRQAKGLEWPILHKPINAAQLINKLRKQAPE
jgi:signal transduction histidine kinase